jgi:hypothetical protein
LINYSNEIFDTVAKDLRSSYKGIQMIGEYVQTPTKFPTVTMDEIQNIPVHLDSAKYNKYARVTIRSQVFCSGTGKRNKARDIFDSLDKKLMDMGFVMKTYTTTPAVYNSEVYCITATHEGVIGADGRVYRG